MCATTAVGDGRCTQGERGEVKVGDSWVQHAEQLCLFDGAGSNLTHSIEPQRRPSGRNRSYVCTCSGASSSDLGIPPCWTRSSLGSASARTRCLHNGALLCKSFPTLNRTGPYVNSFRLCSSSVDTPHWRHCHRRILDRTQFPKPHRWTVPPCRTASLCRWQDGICNLIDRK